jgi:hypothetical protein
VVVALLELEVLAAEDSVVPEVSVPPFKGSNCRANETLAAVTKKNGGRRPFLTNRDVSLEDIYLCRVFVVVVVQGAQSCPLASIRSAAPATSSQLCKKRLSHEHDITKSDGIAQKIVKSYTGV